VKKLLILTLIASQFSFAKIITIIDNGVAREISIDSEGEKGKNSARGAMDCSEEKLKEIILSFKKDSKVDINNFSKKYNLKLKKRLRTGYYIFINKSKESSLKLISKIIKEQKDSIKTIRPNWALGMHPL